MIFSYTWLQEYFEADLPEIKNLVEILTFHAFEIEGIKPDYTDGRGGDLIDIDVLPNRSHDCFCYQGIAKEISVLTGLKLKTINKDFEIKKGLKSSDYLSLKVESPNLIPRAMKRLVQDVKVGPSPDWLREKLESIGQKSINNIVDITNYVMWETGQPVHCFDFDKVAGDSKKDFIIRTAEKGEQITTLDGADFELGENMIVISDKEKALDIAGTKGGIVSGIDENTKNVVLSVCNFNQVNIRKTSKKLGLRTDASIRFENGISPNKVEEAMERLTQLVVEITKGKASEDVLDVYPRKPNPYKVGVSVEEVNKRLGTTLIDNEIENILKKLDFKREKIKPIDKVLELAQTLLDIPYKSGASVVYDAPNLFDCSSLTAYLFAQSGVAIPRISVDQYIWGEKIEKEDLQAGDLVFANTGLIKETGIHTKTIEFLPGTEVPEGIDHVGLSLGENRILHTSSEIGKSIIEDLAEADTFKNIIGYRRISDNSSRYVVTAPHERLDLRIKEDLIEEIGRVYGYKNIESVAVEKSFKPKINPVRNKKSKISIISNGVNKEFYYINKIKNILVSNGFDEVQTYVFGDKGEVEVQKPLASNLGKLRTNLTDGIQRSLELNSKNASVLGLDEIKVFEIGKVFPSLDGEYTALSLGVSVIKKKKREVIENGILMSALTKISENLDIDMPEVTNSVFEINLDKLIEQLPDPESYKGVLNPGNLSINVNDVVGIKDVVDTKKYEKISSYPFMLRDIAIFVPTCPTAGLGNENSAEDILAVIKNNAGDLLVQTKLFDTYAPEGGDKTSYAFNLVFQSQEKTLTDDEINKIMDKITLEVEAKNWTVR
ncbi:MAG: phenylalanine--tRNA ligase beta subunit-related protein [Patescibacteria group bacterium]|nr:phenylalanine--tRNA ligase beta subunit-related protein [Patescibacteria group bacterium]